MKKTLLLALALFTLPAAGGPTVIYVSESGDNRIALFTLNEANGDLTRTGALIRRDRLFIRLQIT